MADSQMKRLHISPLDPALLEIILAPSVRPLATEISFHTLQTFPENNFGFVNLPQTEAEKLMKKLNGSILKGKKFKIQEARERPPSTVDAAQRDAIDSDIHTKKTTPVSLKRKSADIDTIPGYELPSNRKVMRGWTEVPSKERKSDKTKSQKPGRQRSKFSAGDECLFRTAPLPKEKGVESAEDKSKHREKKDKKSTVHEFKHSIKYPSFIRAQNDAPDSKLASEYVEGKGWVDREGNVKESFIPKPEPKPVPIIKQKPVNEKNKKEETNSEVVDSSSESSDDESESSSDSSISDSSDEAEYESSSSNESEQMVSGKVDMSKEQLVTLTDNNSTSSGPVISADDSSTSSDSISSDSDNDTSAESSDDTVEPGKSAPSPPPAPTNAETDKTTSAETEVHPLEALFKRTPNAAPKPQLEINTQFSFFGNTEEDDDIDNDHDSNFHYNNEPPHTPFTKRDLQARNLRSAAPTPDTAAIAKTRFWEDDLNEGIEEEEEEEEENYEEEYATSFQALEEAESPIKAGKSGKTDKKDSEESQFAKWFWENRGDNNRAWKRRRREAAKEKRQKDNRQRGRKGRF